jgi:signal transduction histidine kinase
MTRSRQLAVAAPRHTLSAEFLHDLRTPLNQIIGYSEMLTEQAQEEGQNGFLSDLQMIQIAGRQMLDLLNSGIPALQKDVPESSGRSLEGMPDIQQESRTAATAAEPRSPATSHALILVVDDNRPNRDMLSRRLERQGYSVVTAENGREAMDTARVQPFDLVLLDIMMPGMDGFEVLRRLKADETLQHIPVIMISALDELDSVVRCIEMGAEDYLPKPFNPILLKARIGACLERKAAHDREMQLFGQCRQDYLRLQELEKLRDDLTHMIIHDLRTPLTSVISGMQTVEVIGNLNEDQQEMMGIALGGGETLLGMINDLLDVDKIENGALQLEYVLLSAGDLVADAVSQIARLAKINNLTLVQQVAFDLPPLRGDENTLRRTLVNLLGNAVKFTPPGGTVTVSVQHGEDSRDVVFSVSDTGEGIPPEAFGRIFEKFGQVESRRRGRKMSTGLGLTFCKLAVEAHGGSIKVDSVPDEGSTFSFTVPLIPQAVPDTACAAV